MEKEIKRALNELVYIGYNIKHIGTRMLAEGTAIIIKSNNIEIINDLENNVYSKLAKKYNINMKTVKGNIVNATNYMYNTSDFNRIKKYFSLYEDIKITPKMVINTLIRKLM